MRAVQESPGHAPVMLLQRDDAWLLGIVVVALVTEVALIIKAVEGRGYLWMLIFPLLIAGLIRDNRRNKQRRRPGPTPV